MNRKAACTIYQPQQDLSRASGLSLHAANSNYPNSCVITVLLRFLCLRQNLQPLLALSVSALRRGATRDLVFAVGEPQKDDLARSSTSAPAPLYYYQWPNLLCNPALFVLYLLKHPKVQALPDRALKKYRLKR